MPSNLTSNDIDLVQPTQYNAQPNRVAKSPPLEPWPRPILQRLHISDHDDLIALILLVGSYRYQVDEFRPVKGYQNQKYAYGHGASILLILLASSYR